MFGDLDIDHLVWLTVPWCGHSGFVCEPAMNNSITNKVHV